MVGFSEGEIEWLNELYDSLGIETDANVEEEYLKALVSTAAENNISPDEVTIEYLEEFADSYSRSDIDTGSSDCPVCSGYGYIKEDRPNPIGSGIITDEYQCYACNGTGNR